VNALAALVDARLENGDYDGAETTLNQLLNVNPGTPAYARVSYFRQLTGDLEGARTAMQQAVGATGPGNGRAVVLGYLGDLNLEMGDYDAAEKAYSTALVDQPGNIAAELGRARVLIARGSLNEAAARLDALVTRSPQPAPATLQGELALLQGDSSSADAAFRLVRANQQILRSQGVIADIEYSNFDADRGAWESALETATAAHATRQTIFTADALAWALLNVGRSAEALPLIEEALVLGIATPSIRVHAAAVYAATLQPERARDELAVAFRSTPWLTPSIRPVAARLADELGLTLPENWSSL
jgi:tetratricopeptide (TPR) repeat protein